MAETTADVRRDIEMTRERMSDTLAQLEQKMNVMQVVKEHPWPALGLAFGAGVLLAGSNTDVKAAAATVTATRGASSRVGAVLDDLVANLMTGVHQAFEQRVEQWVTELKSAIGAPAGAGAQSRQGYGPQSGYAGGAGFADMGDANGPVGGTMRGSQAGSQSPTPGGTAGQGNSGGGYPSTLAD